MNILLCVKQVPDVDQMRMDPEYLCELIPVMHRTGKEHGVVQVPGLIAGMSKLRKPGENILERLIGQAAV